MSVFRSIMSRILGRPAAAEPSSPEAAPPGPEEAGRMGGTPAPGMAPPAPQAPPPPAAQTAPEQVDVEAVLTGLAARNPQKLDWRHSIVDLMKVLELDSSLAARKELAQELGYTGALDGSAAMNTWLHRAVMRRLAESGGRVPDDLRG
jgi:hypothetical protein